MKKSIIAKLLLVSSMLFFTSAVFADSEEEHHDWDDPDYKYYAHDSNGNYARDRSGMRVRVGSIPAAPKIEYVERVKNLIEIEKDDIRLVLDGDEGTFAIFAVSEKGNYIPLISPYDSFSSSFFCVKAGGKEYKLQKSHEIKTEARNTPLGAQMAYLISGEVQVVLDFSFMPSIATSSRIDMLRVTVFVINIGRNIQSFSVKGVFDTILGENTSSHFSTFSRKSVNSELQLGSMEDDLWIRSSNKDATVQFLFGSNEISKTEAITLSARDKVEGSTWIPAVQTSKSFNSVTSYNNSALTVNWPQCYLDTFRTSNYGFYISVAIGGNVPAGQQFLSDLENGKTALGAAAKNGSSTTDVAPKPTQITKEEFEKVTPNILENLPASSKEAFVKTKEISEAQMDPDYIQDLLDHIASLKDNESEIDQIELQSLNDELDSILKKLGAER